MYNNYAIAKILYKMRIIKSKVEISKISFYKINKKLTHSINDRCGVR
jgi:hypothetical protein